MSIDQVEGLNEGVAIKAACRVASATNITLAGLLTIDGVTLVDGDRVLVTGQTNAYDNGIWVATTGSWSRPADFNGSRDVINGTLISVNEGSALGLSLWKLSYSGTISIGTTNLTISKILNYQGLTVGVVNVADYGAVGDGVTNDTTALTNAYTYAYNNGKILLYPDDNTYLTTASIPYFHNVPAIGRGIIKRGTDLYYILPENSDDENHIYYDIDSGNNDNDGLSASQPRRTLAQARADILWLNTQGLLAAGYWTFHFSGNATNVGLNLSPLAINSAYPIVFDFDNVTITHNSSTTLDAAISTSVGTFEIHGNLTINGGSKDLTYGVFSRAGQMRIASTATVTVNDSEFGFFADDGCYFTIDSTTTVTDGCTTGCEFNFSDGADFSAHNNCTYGTTLSRNSTAHINTRVTNASATCLLLQHSSRGNFYSTCNFKTSALGVETHDSSVLSIGSGTSLATVCNMGTGDACTKVARHFGSSNNGILTGRTAYPFQFVGCNYSTLTLTGSTAATRMGVVNQTINSTQFVVPAYYFDEKGKKITVRVWGNITNGGTPSNKTISIRRETTAGGSAQTIASRSISNTAGEFDLEFEIVPTSVTAQKFCARGMFGGGTGILGNGTNAGDFTVNTRIAVYGQLVNSGDTITIEGIEMFMSV